MISFSFEVTSKQLYQAAHRESSFYNVAWEYYQGNRHSGSRSATDVDGMQIRAGRRTMVKWESFRIRRLAFGMEGCETGADTGDVRFEVRF
jgi:hypothetical protein